MVILTSLNFAHMHNFFIFFKNYLNVKLVTANQLDEK